MIKNGLESQFMIIKSTNGRDTPSTNSYQIPNAAGTKMELIPPRLVSMAVVNIELSPSPTYPTEAVLN